MIHEYLISTMNMVMLQVPFPYMYDLVRKYVIMMTGSYAGQVVALSLYI